MKHFLLNFEQERLKGLGFCSLYCTICRVIGLQARVNVEPYEVSRFFSDIFLLWNVVQTCI